MKIARGKKAYEASDARAKAVGLTFTDAELETSLKTRLPPLLRDDLGRKQIEDSLSGLSATMFESARLQRALNRTPTPKDWQVGEAFAEAYLGDHLQCDFPWPTGRDLRNPSASPAGADLVGFQHHDKSARFAFGEVKTSEEARWPPQVMTGRHGLVCQLEDLRDTCEIRDHLGLIYLGVRARGAAWEPSWKAASMRYLKNPYDIALFGVLVRDVEPKKADLEKRVARLSGGCPAETSIELFAFYLPKQSIKTLGAKARAAKQK